LVHPDVTTSVDAMLRGEPFPVEQRMRGEDGGIKIDEQRMLVTSSAVTGRRENNSGRDGRNGRSRNKTDDRKTVGGKNGRVQLTEKEAEAAAAEARPDVLNVFAYGVARNRLKQAAKRMRVQINIVDQLPDSDVLVTLKSYYRKRRQLITDAERRRVPVYVLRANTAPQMENFLAQAMNLEVPPTDPFEAAVVEAEKAIAQVTAGQPGVNLNPVGSAIRRYQHQMARQANLVSHSYGKEPQRYVRIFNAKRNQ
jgi:hypothetical protein